MDGVDFVNGADSATVNKLNAGLLASFCKPTPGTPHPNADRLHNAKPKDDINSPWPLELPQPGKEQNDEQKRQLEESEKNFALVVVEPYEWPRFVRCGSSGRAAAIPSSKEASCRPPSRAMWLLATERSPPKTTYSGTT